MRVLDNAIKVVLARNGRLGRAGLRRTEGVEHREITLTELADRNRVRKKGLRSLVESGGIPIAAKGRFCFFNATQVAAIETLLAGLVSEQEAASMLGCSAWTVWGLVQNGRLRGYEKLASGRAHRMSIPRADVEALKIVGRVPVMGESHSVYSLRTFYVRENVPPYEIVERVLTGALKVAAIDPTRQGIHAWRFHILDLAKPARRRPRWKQPPPNGMTKAEAGALTSFHPRTISYLAKLGVLGPFAKDTQWLDRKSVEIFSRDLCKGLALSQGVRLRRL